MNAISRRDLARRRAGRAFAVAVCLTTLAGCGGSEAAGNEPPPGSNPPPTLPPANPPGTPDLGTNAGLNGKIPFPADNAWNVRIDTAQVDPNSAALISSIGLTTSLHPDWGTTETDYGIPYVVVAGSGAQGERHLRLCRRERRRPVPDPGQPADRGRGREQW